MRISAPRCAFSPAARFRQGEAGDEGVMVQADDRCCSAQSLKLATWATKGRLVRGRPGSPRVPGRPDGLIGSAVSARRAAIVPPAQERSEQMQTATAPIATSVFRVRDFSTWASPLQAIVFA
ncbi:hypothetical protein NX02_20945 [Sphingomonas sanxanigenens DSM 19645 = NX02]|uniref:Uncharacterized protein n=1 Tax=Sphingomonas sanxanigenens DSM 19645 = NX02 TaxID=1123269 RepID=W0AJI5_9SPHN|nr:hypothetical protein NX02_20945 [Sphingomonas sanxanigenens DSM 19645 = NX02]